MAETEVEFTSAGYNSVLDTLNFFFSLVLAYTFG